jgi:hypothetical protein
MKMRQPGSASLRATSQLPRVTKQDTQGDFERESGEGMKGELVLLIEGSIFSQGMLFGLGFGESQGQRNFPQARRILVQHGFKPALFHARPVSVPLYKPALGATVLYCEMAGFTIPLKFRSIAGTLADSQTQAGGWRKGTTHSAVSAITAMQELSMNSLYEICFVRSDNI